MMTVLPIRKPKSSSLKPPKHLKAATRCWMEQVLAEYEFDACDGSFQKLVLAAEALERANQAREIIDREGLTILDFRGKPAPHPAAKIQHDFSALFSRLMRELNLSETSPENRPPPLRYGGHK